MTNRRKAKPCCPLKDNRSTKQIRAHLEPAAVLVSELIEEGLIQDQLHGLRLHLWMEARATHDSLTEREEEGGFQKKSTAMFAPNARVRPSVHV